MTRNTLSTRIHDASAGRSVTGRDGFIIRKALAYAITAIERLPSRWQEVSDAADMKRLLESMCDDFNLQHHIVSAVRHIDGAARDAKPAEGA
jgi:ketosteroid isomerase-like protein